jgi:ABC-2 type transport system permease protein
MATNGDAVPLWTLVARREIGVRMRSKMFLISTSLMLVLLVAAMILLHVLSSRTSTSRVAVGDAAAAAVVAEAASLSGNGVLGVESGSVEQARAAVAAGTADAALVPGTNGWLLVSQATPAASLIQAMGQAVRLSAVDTNAAKLGVSAAAVLAGSDLSVLVQEAGAKDSTYRWGITFAFGLLFFLSCQLFGSTIGSSVAEEKESRVVEVLLAAIPVRALLVGKIVGNAALGVAQMALFAAVGLSTAALIGGIPHFGAIVASSGWFLLFYLAGFGAVSCLFAGLGALASRTQDLQAATMPVQLLVTATYMCAVVGKGAVVRIFAGTATWWQVAVSLLAAVVFAVVAVRISVRAYTYSILRTGGRTSLLSSLRGAPDGHPSTEHRSAVGATS